MTSQWDKNLNCAEFTPVKKGGNEIGMGMSYTNNKKQYTIASRDFYEKGFNFYHDGKFYRYSCSIENSEHPGPKGEPPLKPLETGTVRGRCVINCGLMQRNPSDGKILLTQISQMDFGLSVPAFMVNSFLPKAMKSWFDESQKYYTKINKGSK
jgi:hypothetical protein